MEKYYEFEGKINYKDKDGWIVIDVPHSIINYYKVVIEKLIWKKISTPLYGGHISLLPSKHNGDFRKHFAWKKYHGKKVIVKYSPIIYTNELVGNNRYFWLKCETEIVGLIREEFGLEKNLRWPLHITIGYLGE